MFIMHACIICTCTSIIIYTCVYIFLAMCTYEYVSMYTCAICTCMCVNTCMYLKYVHVYMFTCVCKKHQHLFCCLPGVTFLGLTGFWRTYTNVSYISMLGGLTPHDRLPTGCWRGQCNTYRGPEEKTLSPLFGSSSVLHS